MTRNEYERLVEQYLEGAMSPADEQEFFIRVAVDSNLRQTLKAHRIVESAIRKHRDAISSRQLEVRTRLVSMLGPIETHHPGAGSDTITGGSPSETLRPPFSSMTPEFVWSLAAVAAIALAIGVFVVAPMLHRNEAVRPERTATASPRAIAPSSPVPTQHSPTVGQASEHPTVAANQSNTLPPSVVERKGAPAASAQPHGAATLPRSSSTLFDTLHGKREMPAASAGSNEAHEAAAQSTKHGRTPKTRYVSRDTIRIPITIDLPK